jgi:hypothetical protein
MLIDQIKSSTSKEEVRTLLAKKSIEIKHIMLENSINSLNREIESDIHTGNVDVALFKMSQVVMLEDEIHVVERVILKQGVLVR